MASLLIAKFLNFTIQAKFAYVNKLKRADARFLYIGNGEAWTQVQADSACEMEQSLILGGGSGIYERNHLRTFARGCIRKYFIL